MGTMHGSEPHPKRTLLADTPCPMNPRTSDMLAAQWLSLTTDVLLHCMRLGVSPKRHKSLSGKGPITPDFNWYRHELLLRRLEWQYPQNQGWNKGGGPKSVQCRAPIK